MKGYIKKTSLICLAAFFIVSAILSGVAAYAWHDETHLAVAKAAGYKKWYNAAGADIAKIKAGNIESFNHYFNFPGNDAITPGSVLNQAEKYNDPEDNSGHLYGAIIAAVREYEKTSKQGKYASYHIAYLAHYIGDLSQPLHNMPYDDFNRARHKTNDGIVEDEALANMQKIKKHMYPLELSCGDFEKELSREIARIANSAARLGWKLRSENRDMSKTEAYIQLGESASLLRAALACLNK